ncbi:alpha/beta hydrolase [Chromobacterium sp. IIBBL 290-4]|uniref:alpha/beta hydrolase n=1 Tax=Chromobacterium sp. IIBBL 290-4 TaxID=2953890 RepID=UPI0020B6B62A|nr:alpha/beta hydrolase [Chromobacterium sp. IIBBL 290-4]UTH73553.1 alpha/beta hydrolase [Chromobacterium sp. IIBBL 290-4]
MTRYQDLTYWRRYRRFLPDWLQAMPDAAPQETWWRWRDADIHLDRFSAPDAPLTVIILHGAGGYGRLFAPYAQLLHAQGYEVIAPDLPGYGLSRAPAERVRMDQWVDCVKDLAMAQKNATARPVVLFGCSLGGYLVYLAAACGAPVAGIIATTLADPRLPIVRRQFARHPLLGALAPRALPWLDGLCGSLRLPIKWVSNMAAIANSPQAAAVFLRDSLGGGNTVPIGFMRSLFDVKPAIEPEQFDRCPVLLAHPAADRWTTLEASQPFFDRLRGPKQLLLLENCGHFPFEEPGISQLRDGASDFLRALTSPRLSSAYA